MADTAVPTIYAVRVAGAVGSLVRSTPLTLVINAASGDDFSIEVSPPYLWLSPGAGGVLTGQATIDIHRVGQPSAVLLQLEGAGSGLTATFIPNPATGPSSIMTIGGNLDAAAASYALAVKGTAGSVSHSATLDVDVSQPLGCATSPGGTLEFLPIVVASLMWLGRQRPPRRRHASFAGTRVATPEHRTD